MKLKAIFKAVVTGIEIAATLWAAGVFIGAGLRDGAKASDFHDEWFYDVIKSRKIKGLRKKLDKLSKKEQLTKDEKEQQKDLLDELKEWTFVNTREEAVLGTKIVGGFNVHYDIKEATA